MLVPRSSCFFATAALSAVLVGCSIGFAQTLITDKAATGLGMGQNVYGRLMLAVGFSAFAGYFASNSRVKYIFLLGPVLGTIGTLLSTSRGAMLAVPALILILFPFMFFYTQRATRLMILGAVTGAVLLSTLIVSNSLEVRALTAFAVLLELISDGSFTLHGGQRWHMLIAASEAFIDSPLFGHGWANIGKALLVYAPDLSYENPRLLYAHNDIANHIVAFGALGVLVLGSIYVAPILAIIETTQRNAAALYLGLISSVSLVIFGLTDSIIGFDVTTVYYCFVLVIIRSIVLDNAS